MKNLSSDSCILSSGWYLGLRYMQGSGLIARVAEPVDAAHHGTQFIFADRVLCAAAGWRAVLADWFDALATGGHLILWLPDCRHHPLDAHESRLTLDDVAHVLDAKSGWHLRESDLIDGHIFAVWQKRGDAQKIKMPWRKQPRHMLIARTGAHGDALMASSILPWLKEQGWHISFITRASGAEVLKNDPHIDDLIVLQHGQVADDELPYYWQAWSKRFDRFVNLTHSVEGELLKQPGRDDYWWTDGQRRAMCNRSYLGNLHQLADVPGPYRVCFYPSDQEKAWSVRQAEILNRSNTIPLPLREELDRSGFIVWCLRGSAVHKWWPYMPQAICRLLARTEMNFVLTGDDAAQPLADEILQAVRHYHGDDSRIRMMVGTHTIREIMTLAHHAAAVVGPETGVLNAVSMQAVPKILLLSHSGAENLPNDWCAVTALKPTAPCYPCHRLHTNHDWCPQDAATKAAACAASITVEHVVDAILAACKTEPAQPWWLRGEAWNRVA